MFYDGYHLGGMHVIWWFIWGILLFWIFATPYYVPGQRRRKDAPIDLLKKRLSAGKISTEEYCQIKKVLDGN